MNRHIKILLFVVCCSWGGLNALHAQTVIISGVVQNSEHQALELANVIACSPKDSTISTFAITDYEGKFKLEIQQDSSYFLKVVYLGYNEWHEVLTEENKTGFKAIILEPSNLTLQEVTVVYEMPVIVRGDTVSFKADAFTTGKERKLKDVFEKLPGFEVAENGSVKVNGKKVDKITVDGKEFFTGDTKLAAKNIPAGVVDRINVLNNHNDVAQMKSISDQNGVAIDISLKGDKQNILFGSIEAGAGMENRYLGHSNIFYFNPKGSINFIGNANNLGEQIFTFQDLLRFNGGITNMASKSGASTRLSSESLGLLSMKNNKAKEIDTKVGALNFTYTPKKRLQFSGFAIFTAIGIDLLEQSNRTYLGLPNNGTNTETLFSSIFQGSESGIFKLNTKFIPNSKLHVEHNLMLKKAKLEKSQLLLSEQLLNSRYFDTDDLTEVPSFYQNLNLFYTIAPKHLIGVEGSQKYIDSRTSFGLNTTERLYPSIIPTIDDDTINFVQNHNLRTHKLDLGFTYYYLMNETNHFGFSVGTTINNQELSSSLSQYNKTGEEIKFDQEDLKNEVDYQFIDKYVGIYYKTKWGKMTFKPGLYVHDFDLRTDQFNQVEKLNKQLVLPSLYLKYDFKKSTSLILDYKVQTEFYDAQQYAKGSIIRNYNHLFQGNNTLENSWYHNVEMNFHSLNLYNFTNIYGILSYQKKYDNLNNRIVYDQLDRISSPVNIAKPNDLLTLYGALDKRFKNIKTALDISMTYGQFNNILANDQQVLNESFNQRYSGSIETTMDNFPIVEIGFATMINQYKSEAISTQTFTTHRPFANVEIEFLKHFILLIDYEYNWYNNKNLNTSSTYDILNAELFFRKNDSPFEFKISALNLLNTNSIRQDTFSEVLISTSEYFIQKRYFLGGLKYEF